MVNTIGEAIIWFLLFITSATFHEAAHAWAAKRGGDLTAYAGGQVSLNPIPHIRRQPLGMVVIPLFTSFLIGWPFGFASTPYDPVWAYQHPKKAALMAAAGPITHLIIVLVCVTIVKIGILAGFFIEPDWVNIQHIVDPGNSPILERITMVISMFFSLNLIMFVLNLIPLPPLDGSGIITLFLKDETARKYNQVVSNPAFGLVGLFLAWQVFDPLFEWVFLRIINIVYWGAGFA